ncbi:uncharacterized protein LOC107367491 [Tetranychus urticae]|uniref:Chitin-binding type-2 domain-containing protein n=1 Tax=Tetranychus urticae TaxID=32264 RepID=T1KUT6_TETUR|nr:uncharacterized protein LOC107367491 [Tetranychus urticae]
MFQPKPMAICLLLIPLIACFIHLSESANRTIDRVCSSTAGNSYKADPRSCKCFYKCNQAFYQARLCCENDLYFNPATQGCDDPKNVNCTIVAEDLPEYRDSSKTELTSAKPPVKPDLEICFEGIGHYPDPGNTTCFYHCDANNYAHHRCCAPGLAFNPEIRSCAW